MANTLDSKFIDKDGDEAIGDVFLVSRLEVIPAHGSFVVMGIHYHENPMQQARGESKLLRFAMQDSAIPKFTEGLKEAAEFNRAQNVINSANGKAN